MAPESSIRAIGRSTAILQALNRAGSLTMAGIAIASDVPYATAFRIVQTLIEQGLVEREPARKIYRPTAGVQSLSSGYRRDDRLVARARPHIAALTEVHGWPVMLATLAVQWMMIEDSTDAMTALTYHNYHPGYTLPILESAVGQVILAYSAPEERQRIFGLLRARAPEGTSAEPEPFEPREWADAIVARGYSLAERNRFTRTPGKTSSIAVPIFENGRVRAALALVFFAAAMQMDEAVRKFLADLQATARAIGEALDDRGPR